MLLCIIGEFHEFLSKNLSLTRPKNIVGESFIVSKHLGCRKILCNRVEGGYYDSPSVYFLSHFPEKLRRGPFSV